MCANMLYTLKKVKAKQNFRVMALLSSASRGDVSEAAMHLHANRLFSAGPTPFCGLSASTSLCSTIPQV